MVVFIEYYFQVLQVDLRGSVAPINIEMLVYIIGYYRTQIND